MSPGRAPRRNVSSDVNSPGPRFVRKMLAWSGPVAYDAWHEARRHHSRMPSARAPPPCRDPDVPRVVLLLLLLLAHRGRDHRRGGCSPARQSSRGLVALVAARAMG